MVCGHGAEPTCRSKARLSICLGVDVARARASCEAVRFDSWPAGLAECQCFSNTESVRRSTANVVQVSPRGQITLPGPVRKALGLEPGDNLVVSVDGERAIIEPAVVVPIERYTEERTKEFEEAARMSPDEIRRARRKWRL